VSSPPANVIPDDQAPPAHQNKRRKIARSCPADHRACNSARHTFVFCTTRRSSSFQATLIYLLFGQPVAGGAVSCFQQAFLAIVFVILSSPSSGRPLGKLTVPPLGGCFLLPPLAVLNTNRLATPSPTDVWGGSASSLFGFMPLTFLFAALQYSPLLTKNTHRLPSPRT